MIEKQDGGGTGGACVYEGKITIGYGGNGTSYSGGSGSGGASNYTSSSGNGSDYGGAGGNAGFSQRSGTKNAVAGGGVGNPTGKSKGYKAIANAYEIENGTGGLLVIYSDNVINNGTITARGINSKVVLIGDYSKGGYNAPGGASGGGSVNIFYKNNCVNGTISVSGGASATGHVTSGAGGNGSISVGQIVDGTYVSTYTNY